MTSDFPQSVWVILKTVYQTTVRQTHTLHALLVTLRSESGGEQCEGVDNEVEFVGCEVLAAVGGNAEGGALGSRREEVDVHQAGCYSVLCRG